MEQVLKAYLCCLGVLCHKAVLLGVSSLTVYTSILSRVNDHSIESLSLNDSNPYPFYPAVRSPLSNPIWESCTHLHADDGVDEEQHGNEEAHIGQRLETHEHVSSRVPLRLHKPQPGPDPPH